MSFGRHLEHIETNLDKNKVPDDFAQDLLDTVSEPKHNTEFDRMFDNSSHDTKAPNLDDDSSRKPQKESKKEKDSLFKTIVDPSGNDVNVMYNKDRDSYYMLTKTDNGVNRSAEFRCMDHKKPNIMQLQHLASNKTQANQVINLQSWYDAPQNSSFKSSLPEQITIGRGCKIMTANIENNGIRELNIPEKSRIVKSHLRDVTFEQQASFVENSNLDSVRLNKAIVNNTGLKLPVRSLVKNSTVHNTQIMSGDHYGPHTSIENSHLNNVNLANNYGRHSRGAQAIFDSKLNNVIGIGNNHMQSVNLNGSNTSTPIVLDNVDLDKTNIPSSPDNQIGILKGDRAAKMNLMNADLFDLRNGLKSSSSPKDITDDISDATDDPSVKLDLARDGDDAEDTYTPDLE